ncbi:MAG: GWxTD domain-containing protein [Bacteroidales bacterium]|nr:GWxTD domain-containing protein [Bacteroidales bacterium]
MTVKHPKHVCPRGSLVLIVLFSLFLATACGTLKPTASTTTKSLMLYNPGRTELHPDYLVYHGTIDETTLFFRLFTKELLFNKANPDARDQSRVKLEYKLFSSFSEQIQDHDGEQEYVINKEDVKDHYTGTIKIPTEEGKSYLLELILTDIVRQTSSRQLILVDRFNPKSQQNYLILSYPGSLIAFEKFFYSEEYFRIVSSKPPENEMRIAYFKPVKELPRPPFSTVVSPEVRSEPDSVWTLDISEQTLYRLENEGVYLFYPDPGSMNGVYLSNLGNNFPQIISPEDMLPPLQYITSSEEYSEIIHEPDLKKALDEFWLDKGGSFDAARELIKVFYNRVVFANLYFTTDRRGWKTDRGMIYMLMGSPSFVNKSETGESWVYKRINSNQKYTFDFYLTADDLKGYEFILKRTENHRIVWNTAVKSWREGRIYSL